jgi:hypothetical protein
MNIYHHHHHHQPFYAPTAGTQAVFMDYTYGERAITHHKPSAGWWVLTTANAAGTNGLTCLPKHGGARVVTHLITDQLCLSSTIAHRSALIAGPSSSFRGHLCSY